MSERHQQVYVPPPTHVPVRPPNNAQTAYKVVAIIGGVPTSIFDARTQYRIGHTVMQPALDRHRGGLYVFSTIGECLQRDEAAFPRACRALAAPRAILKVLVWNPPQHRVPLRYGIKRSYTFLHATDILPYPVTWGLAGRTGQARTAAVGWEEPLFADFTQGGADAPPLRMPGVLPAPASPPATSSPQLALASRRQPDAVTRAQATTLQLEAEVMEMEGRLALARGLL